MLELEPVNRISDEELLQALSLSLAAKGRMVRLLRILGDHTEHEEVRCELSDLIRSEREHIVRLKALLRAMQSSESEVSELCGLSSELGPELVSLI